MKNKLDHKWFIQDDYKKQCYCLAHDITAIQVMLGNDYGCRKLGVLSLEELLMIGKIAEKINKFVEEEKEEK